ncbi:MAG: agmatinase [Alphaproteobacteria bacterium]|nr:agmatinase [Alphaproteobacteria bacterium]
MASDIGGAEEAGAHFRPRFMDIASFMRLPIVSDPSELDIALIGVPFDLAVTNRPGTRHGPRQVRDMSTLIRRTHHVSLITPRDLVRLGDLGDIEINPFDLDKSLAAIEACIARVTAAGARPMSIGGDHLISLPILRAVAKDGPVGMVHFDAHCDTGGAFMGADYHHGVPFRRAVEEGLLDPKRVIQIGIRGSINALDQWSFSHDSGMRVVYIEEFFEKGPNAIIEEARRVAGDGPTYLSFDVDGLDPVYAPGTGTPEAGGFSMFEAQKMIRGLQGLNIVGADVVEVSPPFDPSGTTALNAATIMFEILCVMAACHPNAKTA